MQTFAINVWCFFLQKIQWGKPINSKCSPGKRSVYTNMVNLTASVSYTWDAYYPRISEMTNASGKTTYSYKGQTNRKTEFKYDGRSRRIAIIETNGTTRIETRYGWCGDRICQARDGNDQPIAYYFEEGAFRPQEDIKKEYYAKDHLGSIRDVLNEADHSIGRYDYDPYGQFIGVPTQKSGFAYAGMYYHGPSGLYLTRYRAYDPRDGRWLSRDPVGESGGINLYAYVEGNPVSFIDPLGLEAELCTRPFYPMPVPYAQHCYIRFNGDNNDTSSFDPNGTHSDPAPDWWPRSCSPTRGNQDDDCIRRNMQNCQANQYGFTGFNCCHCAEQAMQACGISIPRRDWPNWPVNPGPQPGEPGYSPRYRRP